MKPSYEFRTNYFKYDLCVVKTYMILNKMSRVYIVNSMLALTLTLFLQVQFNGE